MPLNMDGSIGPKAREVLELRNLLADKLNIPVVTFDERLTTVEAERRLAETGVSRKKRGKKIDVVAAQIILQTYIDSRRMGEEA
jgi:putative Holliday junction resolvase